MNADLAKQIAPTGVLRAAINLGNPVLASRRDPKDDPHGVSVDLARSLASRLEIELQLKVFDSAAKSVEAVSCDDADVGFFALDPARGAQLRFTAPYVLIQGAYLVRDSSSLHSMEDVDRSGHRIVVGKGSAYDLYLSRVLKHATIERAATSPAVVEEFLRAGADIAAGVRQQLEADSKRLPGLRLLPGDFMTIQQAMGLPATRDDHAFAFVCHFVEDMKTNGFIAAALNRHGITGARVASRA
jgi:polar amino acid transport system substrate-binding protein